MGVDENELAMASRMGHLEAEVAGCKEAIKDVRTSQINFEATSNAAQKEINLKLDNISSTIDQGKGGLRTMALLMSIFSGILGFLLHVSLTLH